MVEAAGVEPHRTLLDSVSYCKCSLAKATESARNSCWRYVLSTQANRVPDRSTIVGNMEG